jgi:hypothetical protein
MILLLIDRTPGTTESVAASLNIPIQVARSTISRLMQFGLIDFNLSPFPQLKTSSVGQAFIRSGGALPERSKDREIHISFVLEKVGHSIFRKRDVDTVPLNHVRDTDHTVDFPLGLEETNETMADRVTQFVAGMLRPGEWLRGVQTINSVLERRYLEVDLNDVKNGQLADGATQELIDALQKTIKTGVLPEASDPEPTGSPEIETTLSPDALIVGGNEHLECFERIVGQAVEDVFVLSTFVTPQEGKYTQRHERIRVALEKACARGVRCHMFYGTSLDDGRKNAIAMQELNKRLSATRKARGVVLTQRDSVKSHVKCLAADDGHGGAVVVLGSSNWLSSPLSAVEASIELTEAGAAAAGLDLLRSIVSKLSTASRSIQTLHFMASDLRRSRSALSASSDKTNIIPVRMKILMAHEQQRLLREIAHDANERLVCCTNKVGAVMVPALFNPAEIAGRRIDDVRVYYSRHTGPIRRRHVREHRTRLNGVVDLIEVDELPVHSKFLLWDKNDIVVSTMNWGSQSGSADNPLDEIGVHLTGPDLAAHLLDKFIKHLTN